MPNTCLDYGSARFVCGFVKYYACRGMYLLLRDVWSVRKKDAKYTCVLPTKVDWHGDGTREAVDGLLQGVVLHMREQEVLLAQSIFHVNSLPACVAPGFLLDVLERPDLALDRMAEVAKAIEARRVVVERLRETCAREGLRALLRRLARMVKDEACCDGWWYYAGRALVAVCPVPGCLGEKSGHALLQELLHLWTAKDVYDCLCLTPASKWYADKAQAHVETVLAHREMARAKMVAFLLPRRPGAPPLPLDVVRELVGDMVEPGLFLT